MQSDFLDEMLDPLAAQLTEESALNILQFRADQRAQSRMDELADKCNEGLLSTEENEEYASRIAAANLIAIFQSKARLRLSTLGHQA